MARYLLDQDVLNQGMRELVETGSSPILGDYAVGNGLFQDLFSGVSSSLRGLAQDHGFELPPRKCSQGHGVPARGGKPLDLTEDRQPDLLRDVFLPGAHVLGRSVIKKLFVFQQSCHFPDKEGITFRSVEDRADKLCLAAPQYRRPGGTPKQPLRSHPVRGMP